MCGKSDLLNVKRFDLPGALHLGPNLDIVYMALKNHRATWFHFKPKRTPRT